MTTDNKPMSKERLATIRRRVEVDVTPTGTLLPPWELAGMVETLLAEVERMKAENVAMRKIAEAVSSTFAMNRYEQCAYCEAEQSTLHTPDCPVTKACALLAVEASNGK